MRSRLVTGELGHGIVIRCGQMADSSLIRIDDESASASVSSGVAMAPPALPSSWL